jgi:hypothetical protein
MKLQSISINDVVYIRVRSFMPKSIPVMESPKCTSFRDYLKSNGIVETIIEFVSTDSDEGDVRTLRYSYVTDEQSEAVAKLAQSYYYS